MKIGDKVRFIHETGGGTVVGFRGKDTVLVEGADGFELPMPLLTMQCEVYLYESG